MNASPEISLSLEERTELSFEDGRLAEVTPATIYELVRDIKDPEHPYTLEQLNVVSKDNIYVGLIEPDGSVPSTGLPIRHIRILFQPTIPHCSMAAIIGLCIKLRVSRCVGEEYFVRVNIAEGAHVNYRALNKQLDDKERVAAALENEALYALMSECLPRAVGDARSERHAGC
jgi:hypothetical protein